MTPWLDIWLQILFGIFVTLGVVLFISYTAWIIYLLCEKGPRG